MVAFFALKIQIKNEAICGCLFKCYAKHFLDMAKNSRICIYVHVIILELFSLFMSNLF